MHVTLLSVYIMKPMCMLNFMLCNCAITHQVIEALIRAHAYTPAKCQLGDEVLNELLKQLNIPVYLHCMLLNHVYRSLESG